MGKIDVAYEWDHGTIIVYSITSCDGAIHWHLPNNIAWWGAIEGMIDYNLIQDAVNDQSDFYNEDY